MSTQTMTPDANSILMNSGGAPALKLDQQGVEVGGRIVAEPRAYQEREYDPRNPGNGALKFYARSGDPIMALTVDIATDQSTGDEDDGVRRLYVQGQRLKASVAGAVREAGRDGLEVGGHLWVAYIGLGTASGPGVNAPKLYQARYIPPAAGAIAANTALMGNLPAQAAPSVPSVTTTPSATITSAPSARTITPEDIDTARQLIASGLDDDVILRSAPTLTPIVLAALRNAS